MRRLVPFLLVSILLVVPVAASAQFSGTLVPCGNDLDGNGVVDVGEQCQACHAVELAQNIINFLVYIASFLAVLIFSWAGLIYVTAAGNPGKIGRAHQMFTDVMVGILIVLAGWLVIDTVMKTLFVGSDLDTGTEQTFGPWNEIQCVRQDLEPSREGDAPGGGDGVVSGEEYEDGDARSRLTAAGVSFYSSGQCTNSANRTCTSLEGIRRDTVDQVLNLKQACTSCNIVITGGTETGHASGAQSHGSGYKIDIDDNDAQFNSFLEQNLTRAGVRAGSHGGARYVDSCGNEYVRESTHWDITVSEGSCSL